MPPMVQKVMYRTRANRTRRLRGESGMVWWTVRGWRRIRSQGLPRPSPRILKRKPSGFNLSPGTVFGSEISITGITGAQFRANRGRIYVKEENSYRRVTLYDQRPGLRNECGREQGSISIAVWRTEIQLLLGAMPEGV